MNKKQWKTLILKALEDGSLSIYNPPLTDADFDSWYQKRPLTRNVKAMIVAFDDAGFVPKVWQDENRIAFS